MDQAEAIKAFLFYSGWDLTVDDPYGLVFRKGCHELSFPADEQELWGEGERGHVSLLKRRIWWWERLKHLLRSWD